MNKWLLTIETHLMGDCRSRQPESSSGYHGEEQSQVHNGLGFYKSHSDIKILCLTPQVKLLALFGQGFVFCVQCHKLNEYSKHGSNMSSIYCTNQKAAKDSFKSLLQLEEWMESIKDVRGRIQGEWNGQHLIVTVPIYRKKNRRA